MTSNGKLFNVCFNSSAQRLMVKTTQKSDIPWSAIFSVIAYNTTARFPLRYFASRIIQGAHFFRLSLSLTFLDFSLTSENFPWLLDIALGRNKETEIIKLNKRSGKTLKRRQHVKIPWLFPEFSLTISTIFHFPRLFPDFQDSGHPGIIQEYKDKATKKRKLVFTAGKKCKKSLYFQRILLDFSRKKNKYGFSLIENSSFHALNIPLTSKLIL